MTPDANENKKLQTVAAKLNPIDAPMFSKMAEHVSFIQEALRVFLRDPELVVLATLPEKKIVNLYGRSAVLDSKCQLGDGRIVNVEVQKADQDHHLKRTRYYGALLTTNITDPGKNFNEVPDVCVVYVTAFDPVGKNRVAYHAYNMLEEFNERIENGYEEWYINAAVQDGSEIARYLKLWVEPDAYSDEFPETSRLKNIYKNTVEGRQEMSSVLSGVLTDVYNDGYGNGRVEGRVEGRGEGIEMMMELYNKLLQLRRPLDAQRVMTDRGYLNEQLHVFFPEHYNE